MTGKPSSLLMEVRGLKDVNMVSSEGASWTFLHEAAATGDEEVVSFLLGHPAIDVNLRTRTGATPFYMACRDNHLGVMRRLLQDHRVDVNMSEMDEWSPLWITCRRGHFWILQMLLASGREFNWTSPGSSGGRLLSPLQISAIHSPGNCATLMRRILEDEERARYQVRLELGWLDIMVPDLFALIIFICDGFLSFATPDPSIRYQESWRSRIARFLRIATSLPMELQMLLCHRVFGCPMNNIPTRLSESAFRRLISS